MLTSSDILAKLLATENITVLRVKAPTASFDIKGRILTLPMWEFTDPNVDEMLILHEVGHALFTTLDGYVSVLEKERHLVHYMNIVEDVRIEKKMKERYPGANKTFYLGYKELNEKDFFEVKDKSKKFFDEMYLIDKVNLYYKVGTDCGFSLTDSEKEIITLVGKCVTEEDVHRVSRIIYEMDSKKKTNDAIDIDSLELDKTPSDGSGHSLNMNVIVEEDDDDDSENETDSSKENDFSGGDGKKDLKSLTQEAFDRHLLVVQNSVKDEIVYLIPEFFIKKPNIMIGYKDILNDLDRSNHSLNIKIEKASSTTNKIVSNLLKEFEMKKSAQSLKYSTVSKTGQLSASKLFAYKTKDDIFKKITRVKDSKRHGMIFLLDWSGSMMKHMSSTLDQVLNLALFCKRGGIPFQVFAFSDHYNNTISFYHKNSTVTQNGIGDARSLSLLEFFSDKMTIPEIERMHSYMQNSRYLDRKYHLGSTPLNESLVFMVDYLQEFIQKNSVEKMSFITFTDGEAGKTIGYSTNRFKRVFVRDPMTRREYRVENHSALTEVLMKIIKHRYPIVDTAGFYISNVSGGGSGGVWNFCAHHYPSNRNVIEYKTEMIKEGMKKNGFFIEKNLAGRDVYYILNSNRLNVDDVELEDIEEDSTSSKIAQKFAKSVNSGKNSRIVLNKFIEQIA